MKTLLVLISFLCIFSSASAQDKADTTGMQAQEEYWRKWYLDLYEIGVGQNKDSLKITPEVIRIMQDTAYSNAIYPATYTWPAAMDLVKTMALKKAFWHMINLYSGDEQMKNLVVAFLLPFDQRFEMDKILIASFYTYGMTDPEATSFRDGKIQITRPDIIEAKFNNMRNLITIIKSKRPKE